MDIKWELESSGKWIDFEQGHERKFSKPTTTLHNYCWKCIYQINYKVINNKIVQMMFASHHIKKELNE